MSPPGFARLRCALSGAFTLVEILVSLAVLTILLLISAQVIGQVQSTWTASNARVSQFREARTAFDIITRNLSQATLNTYVDYSTSYLSDTASILTAAPEKYERKSDLQFICGPAGGGGGLVNGAGTADDSVLPGHAVFFQAPLGVSHTPALVGLDRLLCARGYFVKFSSDAFFRPPFLPSGGLRYRYRLMEYSPPAEKNLIYTTGTATTGTSWYGNAGAEMATDENPENLSLTRPVADNILTLIISPQLERAIAIGGAEPTRIASKFAYDSSVISTSIPGLGVQGTQHLLPPLVRVVLVAIDERSAQRLSEAAGEESDQPPFGSELNIFQNAAELDDNLEDIKKTLSEKRVNFRIFSATIQLRGAKWSI